MSVRTLDRRRFLRAAGVSIALPLFESTSPRRLIASGSAVGVTGKRPRIVAIGNMLGFYPEAFWPTDAGSGKLSTTLAPLQPVRDRLTVIGGLDHGLKGGHFSIHAFLSGVRQIDAKSMPEGNMTLDQLAAESVAGQTRFSSLTVGSLDGIHGGCQMSWTRSGTRVPPVSGPRELFRKLFVDESKGRLDESKAQFGLRASILDGVGEAARDLQPKLSGTDQRKLDEYLTSIRDVEKRLQLSRQWIDIPKPPAPLPEPANGDMVDDLPLLYDLIAMALQADSTRVATLEIGGDFEARAFGYSKGYHALSHHGQVRESINALIEIETYQVAQLGRFLQKLQSLTDQSGPLLDQTMVLFGSGMGNANNHTNSNLPIVLAGGPFRHTGLLRFDKDDKTRPPLNNLYLTMLQQFGMEIDRFSTSTGTLRHLEVTS